MKNQGLRIFGRRGAVSAILSIALVIGMLAVPAHATGGSAVASAVMDGFHYFDGSRDVVVDTVGFCPFGERVSTTHCAEDVVGGTAEVHTGLLGFDAFRKVTPAVPSPVDEAVSRRVLRVEVAPRRAGALTVTVDASPAGGASFALVPATALPAADSGSGQRLSWSAAASGDDWDEGRLVFAVAYDVQLGDEGAADAVPAVTVELDFGAGGVVVEHLRGEVTGPAGVSVARTSRLEMTARVVGDIAPPELTAGSLSPEQLGGHLGFRMSTHQDIVARGDAPPLTYPAEDAVAEYYEEGRYIVGLTASWTMGALSDSVGAGFIVEDEEFGEPPFFRLGALLRYFGGEGTGLADGDAGRAVYHALVKPSALFNPPRDAEPSNNDGRMEFVWDGRVVDEVGFHDRYGHAPWEGRNAPEPPYEFLQSMWNIEYRMVGGDMDRRDPGPNPPPVTLLYDIMMERLNGAVPDASMRLQAPPGWMALRVIMLGGPLPATQGSYTFEDDGSVTFGRRLRDGEFWLESELGPDGKHTWAWPGSVFVDFGRDEAWPLEGPLPIAPASVTQHLVAPGETLPIESAMVTGERHSLTLAPGFHTVLHRSDGSMVLLDGSQNPLDGWHAALAG